MKLKLAQGKYEGKGTNGEILGPCWRTYRIVGHECEAKINNCQNFWNDPKYFLRNGEGFRVPRKNVLHMEVI